MTAPMTPDEARLRELAEAVKSRAAWRLSRTLRYVMDGWGSPWVCEVTQRPGWEDTAAFLEAAQPATILALLDALSAERERGDRAEVRVAEAYQVIGVIADAGGLWDHDDVQRALTYFADEDPKAEILPFSLATQKAEGA